MTDKTGLSQLIKKKASELGFSACGIASSHSITTYKSEYKAWLEKGCHSNMRYLENHFEKRFNPELLVENTKSIVCVALNYYPEKKLKENQLQFAYYAYGKDYHDIMKAKLTELLFYIQSQEASIEGRVFCDTAPVLERYWAQQAGIGWIGKNNLLLIPKAGSYFFLGEIFLTTELAYDQPIKSYCGTCKICIKRCPTKALEKPNFLNANKCLSYLTIEHKEELPTEFIEKTDNRLYGCDECQKVCPWNRFAKPTSIPEFSPSSDFLCMSPKDWNELSTEAYQKLFKNSAVKRVKYEKLKKNIKLLKK